MGEGWYFQCLPGEGIYRFFDFNWYLFNYDNNYYCGFLGLTFIGTFGQVLECLDNEKKEVVAIKIVRSINKYREAAMIEIDVLQRLSRHDVGGTR